MPDHYQHGDYDLAGFCVGVVDKKRLIDGSAIAPDDVVIGVASSGVHSNGYSLVRKIVFDAAKLGVDDMVADTGKTVGETLLEPTLIYTQAIKRILDHYKVKNVVHGIAHITGGGLCENIERILKPGVEVNVTAGSWEVPPVFDWLQGLGKVADDEMDRVFNMGIGIALIVSPFYAESIQKMLSSAGLQNWVVGAVKSSTDAPVVNKI